MFDRKKPIVYRGLLSACLMMIIACCGKGPPVTGLIPEYPPVKIKSFALYSEFTEVDSMQPTFRWQPFLPSSVATAEDTDLTEAIEDVTYELRIWRTVAGRFSRLTYVRRDLKTSEHRLETPLSPDTRYFWSVRAHFKLHGRPRTTEWSMAGFALFNEAVPNKSCLRFKTPE
jgi:hypothetical protein